MGYLGAFNASALGRPTDDLPLVTGTELAACDVPHVSMVTDCILVQAASRGRNALLTAPTVTPHFGLTLKDRRWPSERKTLSENAVVQSWNRIGTEK